MAVKLRPIDEQVMVLTGATSGIGLVTARRAAEEGARLVLCSRNEGDLGELVHEIESRGGQAAAVAGDVADPETHRRLAEAALSRFGRIDTWVNDAGLSVVGKTVDVPMADFRRMFETNFWGMVNGSLEAVKHLGRGGGEGSGFGGALINLGSLASDAAFPLQGMYCASKHAIKAFTETLRMELENDGAPISVTIIKPAGIDTPFPEHAGKRMAEQPNLPPPVYPPKEVAYAILSAAVKPMRQVYVGGASKALSMMGRIAPRASELLARKTMVSSQKRSYPAEHIEGSLYRPGSGLRERGRHEGHVAKTSVYTRAALNPWVTGAVVGAAGLLVLGAMAGSGKGRRR